MKIRKYLPVILALTILASLVLCKLAESSCYAHSAPGKTLNRQTIYAIDCFTGRFNPPVILNPEKSDYFADKYGLFNFDRFRYMYLGLVGAVLITTICMLFRKRWLSVFFSTISFLTAIVALIYFDGYHNYYFDSAAEKFEQGVTMDIDFNWLSNVLFWLLMATLLFYNWISIFQSRRKIPNNMLLDN